MFNVSVRVLLHQEALILSAWLHTYLSSVRACLFSFLSDVVVESCCSFGSLAAVNSYDLCLHSFSKKKKRKEKQAVEESIKKKKNSSFLLLVLIYCG